MSEHKIKDYLRIRKMKIRFSTLMTPTTMTTTTTLYQNTTDQIRSTKYIYDSLKVMSHTISLINYDIHVNCMFTMHVYDIQS